MKAFFSFDSFSLFFLLPSLTCVSTLLLAGVNVLLLLYLMWIVISKLKSGTGTEFEKSRRAARSFLLIVFLLGGGYIFVSTGPNDCIPFEYIQVILIAPQIRRSTSKSPQGTTSTSIKKRISSGLFVRKKSNSMINAPQPKVNASSNVVDNANLQTCHNQNDLPTPGAQNEAFVNELQ
ncbi:uncharacterized protein LOC105846969 isoform X2 [Hydra vulgaris]|uniref:uncharacterized protein LOC105846969 isoform X2 n=1 Tax=Hydra vulgaris TaxID=6087 RepID=UPI001F5E4D52|nr:uncharacterized protein LOC105846969 isoform X2 [Hydra vulgaris]